MCSAWCSLLAMACINSCQTRDEISRMVCGYIRDCVQNGMDDFCESESEAWVMYEYVMNSRHSHKSIPSWLKKNTQSLLLGISFWWTEPHHHLASVLGPDIWVVMVSLFLWSFFRNVSMFLNTDLNHFLFITQWLFFPQPLDSTFSFHHSADQLLTSTFTNFAKQKSKSGLLWCLPYQVCI